MRSSLFVLLLLAACAPSMPESIDTTRDHYLERRASPDALIDANGNYQGGWYEAFTGEFNVKKASGDAYNLKKWLHFNIDDPRFYVVAQMVRTDFAGNIAIVVTDKQTGTFHSEDVVQMFSSSLSGDDASTTFTDTQTGSRMSLLDGVLDFDVVANGVRVKGKAHEVLLPAYVQITRMNDGYGALGFWGNLAVDEATVTIDGEDHALAPGSLGLYDRTVGHQRTTLNWNYVATSGRARNRVTNEVRDFSVQGSIDRPRTRPQVRSQNHGFWLGNTFSKVEELVFDYEVTNEKTRDTSPWHVFTPSAPGRATRLDLTIGPPPGFDALFHRSNQSADLWVVERDFHQFYGIVTGSLELNGETWDLEPNTWALAEEALVIL